MDMTIIQQGVFTSNGNAATLAIRSDVDWIKVINYTVASNDQTDAIGVEYFWQRGMPAGGGIEYKKSDAGNADNLVVAMDGTGFTLVDSSVNNPGALVALTAISNANPPVVTTASTAGLNDGDVVRIINVAGAQQLGGMDFTIDVLGGTTFSLEYMVPIVAGTAGHYRVIPFNPIFYPRNRSIVSISNAAQAVVVLSVTHQYTVGQQVRFNVPTIFGMQEINGLTGNVVAIDLTTNSITVDIDSTGFSAFDFPVTADVPFTPAQTVPVGEAAVNTPAMPWANLLDDATENTGFIGITLGAGEDGPAGQDNDEIFWIAGKSFSANEIVAQQ